MTALKALFKSADLFFLFRWPLFLGYTAALYVTFTLPLKEIPPAVMQANDKVLHFLAFFLLALLAFEAFFYSRFSLFRNAAVGKSVIFSIFYGAFLEWVQVQAPGRTASFSDWIVDIAGIFLAAAVFRISQLTPSPQHVRLAPSHTNRDGSLMPKRTENRP